MHNHTFPLQPASQEIWDSKYRLKKMDGTPVDGTIEDTYKRVAHALASVEDPSIRDFWYEKFYWALENGAIPAGRIISNAGSLEYKPATSTINCTVSDQIPDSMDGILSKVHEAGLTLKAGCGIGYDFSTLRPRGAFVSGAGAHTSGPLSFMDIFDRMCFTVASAGGRRGAQMATFDVRHPDVLEFIRAKREDGRLRQFNMSLLITEKFMKTVEADGDWHLIFPVSKSEYPTVSAATEAIGKENLKWDKWPTRANYFSNPQGDVLCKIYETIKAREIWDTIMTSTYDYAEPGFILIDTVNKMNNNWFCEDIRATNPCGEQPLPPYGACLLGSVNLTKFVKNPFTPRADFDFEKYSEVVRIFTRMLDNVVEINGLPLGQQRDEIMNKRRHGMGFLGLGSAMTMLRMKYGSPESIEFTELVAKKMAQVGLREGSILAMEKGPAPIMEEDFIVTEEMLSKKPQMLKDGYKVGDTVKGKTLWVKYSDYIQKFNGVDNVLMEHLHEYGSRFTHHTSIAPTGTISLSLANNVSNGIEPSFSHSYLRNVIVPGKKTKDQVEVVSFELLAYRQLVNSDATVEDLPDYFVSAADIDPEAHVRVQAAAQKWIDSSISKTVNIPTDFPYEKFKDVYLYAWKMGLKGCTTFRFNPEAFQGVLVNESDLENTLYKFTLEDGTHIELKGNEMVEYDGAVHTAANLYDAIKEGYYGKF